MFKLLKKLYNYIVYGGNDECKVLPYVELVYESHKPINRCKPVKLAPIRYFEGYKFR